MRDKDLVLKVNEIFKSIQGESLMQGFPCVFVRLHGCNLNCSYCDTIQKKDDYTFMTAEEVYDRIKSFNCEYICITGGEPLLQSEALTKLIGLLNNYKVSIETNGTMPTPKYWSLVLYKNVNFTFDIKTPSSGYLIDDKFEVFRNMWLTTENTEFKFVVSNDEDLEFSVSAMEKIKRFYFDYWKDTDYPQFSFSPVCFKVNKEYFEFAKYIADYLVENNINARLQLQLHKLIGVK